MKKIFAWTVILALFALTACSGKKTNAAQNADENPDSLIEAAEGNDTAETHQPIVSEESAEDYGKIKRIIYSHEELKDFENEAFEIVLLETCNFSIPFYSAVLGIWNLKELNDIWMYLIVIRNEKVEKCFGLATPITKSSLLTNFEENVFSKQISLFKILDLYSFRYDFNHDGNDEILTLTQNNITGSIHIRIYVIDIYSDDIKKALDISEFPSFSVYPEFINYKCRQGIKFFDGEEYVFYYYDRLQQEYVQDKEAASEELKQIQGSPDFFAETGIDYTKLARPLVPADLEGFSKPALRIWRNAVYARHGRTFASEDLQALFNEYAWYKPDEKYSDEKLTEIDRANIRLIQEFEQKM